MESRQFLERGRQKAEAGDTATLISFAITCLTHVFGVAITFIMTALSHFYGPGTSKVLDIHLKT